MLFFFPKSRRGDCIVGQGKNADYQHFRLFQQIPIPDSYKEWDCVLTVSSIYTHFNTLKKKAFAKHCGER